MEKNYLIVALISILILGIIRLLFDKKKLIKKYQFAIEFLEKLKEYISSQGKDNELYSWLIHRSNKIQSEMGILGISKFKPPHQNHYISNYSIILNMLPELRKTFDEGISLDPLKTHYSNTLQEALVRYIGFIEDRLDSIQKLLKNPFIWFRNGFRVIFEFPLQLLYWMGLLKKSTANKITGNFLFKIISGFIAILSLLGTIITISLGWNQFYSIICKNF